MQVVGRFRMITVLLNLTIWNQQLEEKSSYGLLKDSIFDSKLASTK
jgi:hypothetical protein